MGPIELLIVVAFVAFLFLVSRSSRGIGLYLATLSIELIGVWVRNLLFTLLGLFILFVNNPAYFGWRVFNLQIESPPISSSLVSTLNLIATIGFLAAWGPVALSLATILFLPGGFLFTRFALGAREPSARERQAVQAALSQILEAAPPGTLAPTRYFVLDKVDLSAYVVGTTLYVTRELIKSPYLTPVIAHEYGHINSLDGRLTLAVRRLVLPPVYALYQSSGQAAPGTLVVKQVSADPVVLMAQGLAGLFSLVLSLAGGGLGLTALNPLWVWYWRGREYEADAFAARCGQGPALVEYLERNEFFDVAAPYFLSEHPYTELRIDRLLQYSGQAVETSAEEGKKGIGKEDLDWISEKMDDFLEVIQEGFQKHGRGAAVMRKEDSIDDEYVLDYYTQDQVRELLEREARHAVAAYDPDQEFVVVFLGGENKQRTYRVSLPLTSKRAVAPAS